MNRAERRQEARRQASRRRHPSMVWCDDLDCPGDPENDWIVCTDPGCDSETHRLEVIGAGVALEVRGGVPWDGPSTMDCGCVLTLRRYSEIVR